VPVAGVAGRDRVLDVARGTGIAAARVNEASRAECRVAGLDINAGMLNVARRAPGIDWRLGGATEMTFPNSSFDVVLCQQGLQYSPDRQAALTEIARVLASDGRLSLNVWGPSSAMRCRPPWSTCLPGRSAWMRSPLSIWVSR
jgi:ubiquinone/menaquinone biosynthesis C-methylase UbiE